MNLDSQFKKAQELRDNGSFDQAIDEYQHVRENALIAGNQWLAAECLHMIGVTYYQQNEFEMAKDYFTRSIEAFQQQSKPDFIAIVQRDLGLTSLKEKDYTSATKFLQQSITGLSSTSLKGQLGASQEKLGVVQAASGNLEQGEETIKRGIIILQESEDKFFLASAYFDLAKVQRDAGKNIEAVDSAKKSLEVLNSFSGEESFLLRRQAITDFLALI